MFISKHKSQHTNTHYKQRNEEIIPIPNTPHLYIAASTRLQRPDSEPHAPLPRAGPTPQRAGGGKGKDCTPDGGRHSKDQREAEMPPLNQSSGAMRRLGMINL
eukprot:scaffold861_cov123-Isochrysis_galbana.AAC.1